MSLHLNQQCQRADAHPLPVRLVPGIGCSDLRRRETNARPHQKAAFACWRRIYVRLLRPSTRFFATLLQLALWLAQGIAKTPSSNAQDNAGNADFNGSQDIEIRRFF